MPKRLFLFAGYDKDGFIDETLVFYIAELAKLGDVILCMDSNCSDAEIKKVQSYTLITIAQRHYEYDFGSYKRAYIYAKEHNLLNNYDIIYLVNDSVYGPLFSLQSVLQKIEHFGTAVFGLVQSKHRTYSPIESWFVGITKSVFITDWFDKFISSVVKQTNKFQVTILYENGLSFLFDNHNIPYKCLLSVYGRVTYNNPKKLYNHGVPFIKKVSFTRHYGALGWQIQSLLKKTPMKTIILNSINRIYGKEYVAWFLTKNIFITLTRKIKYFIHKIRCGGL